MRIFWAVLLFLSVPAVAEIVTVDFVKVLNDHRDEAVFYYEENWKLHRIHAMERGFISSWKLLLKTSDDGSTDILLITGYGNEEQYAKREENFAEVMGEARPDGPALLNDIPPGDFREVVDGGVYWSEQTPVQRNIPVTRPTD